MTTTSKIALITGGSRGLGKDMALNVAKRGIDVILTYHTNKTEALNVVDDIRKSGRKASALQLNTGDIKLFPEFVGRVKSSLKDIFDTDRFDFLVNNAGTGVHASFPETTEDQFDSQMSIHFKGVYFLTQKLLPLINDGGRIINISTGLARFSNPGYSAYASMKGAVEVLTKYMAKEL